MLRRLVPLAARAAVRDFLWRVLDVRWMLRSRLPVQVRGLSDWVIYGDIFIDGEYDEAIERTYAALEPGEVAHILDLGANVGFFALRCLDVAHRRGLDWARLDLMLIEGSAPVYRDLTARVRQWEGAHGAVRAQFGLAGLHEGSAAMRQEALHCMTRVVQDGARGSAGVRVPYLDLRPYFREAGVVHLLKCDIEGSELSFLETYRPELARVRAVVIELHKDLCDAQACLRILRDAGFRNLRMLRDLPAIGVAFAWR